MDVVILKCIEMINMFEYEKCAKIHVSFKWAFLYILRPKKKKKKASAGFLSFIYFTFTSDSHKTYFISRILRII